MSEIRTSETIGEIAAALAAAQAEIENVAKSGKNPHFRSSYATLPDTLDEARPKLAKHGIAVFQSACNGEGDEVGVVTRLIHKSGEWLESSLFVKPTKYDAQGVGSVITYLRRYGLMAAVGIAGDDDDGEAAVGRPHRDGATSSRPAPISLRAAPAPPTSREVAPPHDPETGEVVPHEIAWASTTITDDASRLVAGIRNASGQTEILQWLQRNTKLINAMPERLRKRFDAAVGAEIERTGDDGSTAESMDLVTEEDAKGALMG